MVNSEFGMGISRSAKTGIETAKINLFLIVLKLKKCVSR